MMIPEEWQIGITNLTTSISGMKDPLGIVLNISFYDLLVNSFHELLWLNILCPNYVLRLVELYYMPLGAERVP